MTETVWQCEQLRAGQVYNKEMFNTRAEAEQFVAKMARVEPDIFCRIEPIDVEKVSGIECVFYEPTELDAWTAYLRSTSNVRVLAQLTSSPLNSSAAKRSKLL